MTTNRDTDCRNRLEQEVTILKRENNELRTNLDGLTHLHTATSMLAGLPRADEMETLVKDGKRLDWILSEAGKYWLSSRKEIDLVMEEYYDYE